MEGMERGLGEPVGSHPVPKGPGGGRTAPTGRPHVYVQPPRGAAATLAVLFREWGDDQSLPRKGWTYCSAMSQGKKIHVSCDTSVT